MEINERIKLKRLEKGFTLEELASKIDVGKSTIFKYENGDISNIPSDKIEKIAEALDTTPQYLMGWDDMQEDELKEREELMNEILLNAETLSKTITDTVEESHNLLKFIFNKFDIEYDKNISEEELSNKLLSKKDKFSEKEVDDMYDLVSENVKELKKTKLNIEALKKKQKYLKELYDLKYRK